jgi:hypothetical protein
MKTVAIDVPRNLIYVLFEFEFTDMLLMPLNDAISYNWHIKSLECALLSY